MVPNAHGLPVEVINETLRTPKGHVLRPYQPLSEVETKALAAAAKDSSLYPDGSSRELRQTVLGVIYGVTQDVDLDAGIRRGNDPAIDRALLFGVTLRW